MPKHLVTCEKEKSIKSLPGIMATLNPNVVRNRPDTCHAVGSQTGLEGVTCRRLLLHLPWCTVRAGDSVGLSPKSLWLYLLSCFLWLLHVSTSQSGHASLCFRSSVPGLPPPAQPRGEDALIISHPSNPPIPPFQF